MPSSSHKTPPATDGTTSPGLTQAMAFGVACVQFSINPRRHFRPTSTVPRGALGVGGGAIATVLTLCQWHAECKWQRSSKTSFGCLCCWRSHVPPLMMTRSGKGPFPSKMCRRPLPCVVPTSVTTGLSMLSTISAAMWPLCPHTETEQSTGQPTCSKASDTANIRPYGSYMRPSAHRPDVR